MPRYVVTLTDHEVQELIQKGGKSYRIKHALKLDQKLENADWTNCIQEAYGANHNTITGIAKCFVIDEMETTLERKK